MLEVRRLRLLHELQVRGTLVAVAAAMNQSPSAVSQQLAQLEQEVGVELLHKVGRRVQLTLQAEILCDHVAIVLERLERAEADLAASLTTVTGTVRIAVFQSVAIALIPRFLTIIASQYPDLTVELTQREPDLAQYESWSREFDIVVTQQYPDEPAPHHPELDVVPLTADALRLAVPAGSSPWAGIRNLSDAADAPWAMEPRGVASRHWAEEACRRAGFKPHVRFEVTDLQTQSGLIEAGHAVALMPDLFARGLRSSMRMVELPGLPERNIFTSVRRSLSTSPRIRACREILGRAVQSPLSEARENP